MYQDQKRNLRCKSNFSGPLEKKVTTTAWFQGALTRVLSHDLRPMSRMLYVNVGNPNIYVHKHSASTQLTTEETQVSVSADTANILAMGFFLLMI